MSIFSFNPVQEEYVKIMTRALERFGKEFSTDPLQLQVRMNVREGQMEYYLVRNYGHKIKFLKFKEILGSGIVIDFMEYEDKVPPVLQMAIFGLSQRYNIPVDQVYIFNVCLGKKKLGLALYSGGAFYKDLKFDELMEIFTSMQKQA